MKKKYEKTPVYAQWLSLKKRYRGYIFFQMGEFYELFDDDAKVLAPMLGLTLTKRNKKDINSLPLAGFPIKMLKTYISKIIDKNIKIIICNQSGTKNKHGIMNRYVHQVLSPGTIQKKEGLKSEDSNYIMSIVIGAFEISVSMLEWSTGNFIVNMFNTEDNIIDLINNYSISEVIVLQSQEKKLDKILRHLKSLKKFIVFIKQINVNLISSLKIHNKIIIENKSTCIACNIIMEYVKDMHLSIPLHIDSIDVSFKNEFLMIDNQTLKNIGMIDINDFKKDTGTFFFLIKQHLLTNMAKRYLVNILKYPLTNQAQIIYRQNIVEFFVDNYDIYGTLKKYLSRISDIERFKGKCIGNKLKIKDLIQLKYTLDNLNIIIKILLKQKTHVFLFDFAKSFCDCFNIVKLLNKALIFNYKIFSKSKKKKQKNSFSELSESLFRKTYNKNLDKICVTIDGYINDIIYLENKEKKKN